MNLASPLQLLALLALFPLGAAWLHAAHRRRLADAAYGGAPALRVGRSSGRQYVREGLLFATIVLIALALARPQWGFAERPLTHRGIDIVIALDISRSMTATDVAPSRAGAAVNAIRSMLPHLEGNRVGLVTFGGTAFARSPLTLDLAAISDPVGRAQAERLLVQPGSDFGPALDRALQLLDVPDRAQTQVVVLFSDGEPVAPGTVDLQRSLDAGIAHVQDAKVHVYTVAIGTEAGAPLPGGEGVGGSQDVVTRADRGTLARIATATGGDMREVDRAPGLVVDFVKLAQTEFDKNSQPAPVERFQWFLGAAAGLLVMRWFIPAGRRSSGLGADGGEGKLSVSRPRVTPMGRAGQQ